MLNLFSYLEIINLVHQFQSKVLGKRHEIEINALKQKVLLMQSIF